MNRAYGMLTNYLTNVSEPHVGTGNSVPKPLIGSDAGIYYGLPSESISNFTGLTQALPSDLINQTISFSDFLSYSHKKHNMRFGFDIRRVHADSIGGSHAVVAVAFLGYATHNAATTEPCTP